MSNNTPPEVLGELGKTTAISGRLSTILAGSVINGWQSHGKFNTNPGLGAQILYMPREWLKLVFNLYGFGEDNVGLPHTQRIHTNDSIEVRRFNQPESNGILKIAFSLTGDAGCQYGGGISCTGHGGPKSSFLGWMTDHRMWFHKDLFAGGRPNEQPGPLPDFVAANQWRQCVHGKALLHRKSWR